MLKVFGRRVLDRRRNVFSPSDDLQSQPQSERPRDEPFGGVGDWKQQRNVDHILQPHKQKLHFVSKLGMFGGERNIRFSPVWLYIWVCKELGRVNRLSQTLHLCFFCVLDETLELNWPIID
jgi:hypothetical protein